METKFYHLFAKKQTLRLLIGLFLVFFLPTKQGWGQCTTITDVQAGARPTCGGTGYLYVSMSSTVPNYNGSYSLFANGGYISAGSYGGTFSVPYQYLTTPFTNFFIRDPDGCDSPIFYTYIDISAAPIITSVVSSQKATCGGNGGSITLAVNNGRQYGSYYLLSQGTSISQGAFIQNSPSCGGNCPGQIVFTTIGNVGTLTSLSIQDAAYSCTSPTISTNIDMSCTPAFTAGSIGTAQTICQGVIPATLTQVTAASGGTGAYTYQWQSSPDGNTWTDIAAAGTGATYTPPILIVNTQYRRKVSSGAFTPLFSNTVIITVQPTLSAGSIAGAQTICRGAIPAPLTQSTAASGGTGTYTYQWQSSTNGTTWTDITGATSATYSFPATLSVTTQYKRRVSSGVCAAVFSNTVIITVQPTLSAGSIAGAQTICQGAIPISLTQSTVASGGAGAYTYQWQSSPDSSTWTDIAGATSTTYAPTALSVTTQYRRKVSTQNCIAFTPAVTVTVQPTLTSGNISNAQTICQGTIPAPLTEITAATGGTGTYTYQWQSSTNGTTWSNVGTNSPNYSFTATLSATTQYRRRVSSGVCAAVLSNTIIVTVQPTLTSGNIGGTQTVCEGVIPATLTSTSSAVGGTGIYSYQWQSSPDGSTWTDITDATSTTYTPPALTTTTQYRRRVGSQSCIAFTSAVIITVQPKLIAGSIGDNQLIFRDAIPATLTSTSNAVGGTDMYSYQWQSSPDGSTWTDIITSGTNITYTPPALINTTQYRRRVSSGVCTAVFSNIVIITVQPTLNAGNIVSNGGNTAICAGEIPFGVGFGSGVGFPGGVSAPDNYGTVTYQWQYREDRGQIGDNWISLPNSNTAYYYPNRALYVTTFYRRIAYVPNYEKGISNEQQLTVSAENNLNIAGIIINPSAEVYENTPLTISATLSDTYDGNFSWERLSIGGNQPLSSDQSITDTPPVGTHIYKLSIHTCKGIISKEVTVIVKSQPSGGIGSTKLVSTSPTDFAMLRNELNEFYSQTSLDGKFYFAYKEDYKQIADTYLKCYLYDWQRKEITQTAITKQFGMNYYEFSLAGVCKNNEFYTIEVYDDNHRKSMLRFQYVSNMPLNVQLSESGDDCVNGQTVYKARIVGGKIPYKIKWYYQVGDNGNVLQDGVNMPVEVRTQKMQDGICFVEYVVEHTALLNKYIRMKVEVQDATGTPIINAQTQAKQITNCVPNNNREVPRFQIIASIRNLLGERFDPTIIRLY